ncbi:MAG: hypothetical protein Q7U96_00355 [Chloroflexota bacterium]|nr:hypothetical protein [Chloroflexota bacterium]
MSNRPSGGKARFAPTEWLAGVAAAVQDDDLLSPQERAGVLLALRKGDGLGSAVSFGSITFHLVDGQVVRAAELREERCAVPGNGNGRRAGYSLHLKEGKVVRAAMGWSGPRRFTTRGRSGTWQPPEAKYARRPGCLRLPTGRPPRIL